LLSLWVGLVLLAHRKNLLEEFSLLIARRHDHPQPEQPRL